ncbi:MAG: BamA/TamA family outer membrane protein [bacterium]|nr:BamA/TamA family outer membrane protein [bacterium]
MKIKTEYKNLACIVSMVAMTTVLACSVAFAEEEYSPFHIINNDETKLSKAIQLNTTQVQTPTANKETPYNLRSFGEDEYFSSTHLPPPNQPELREKTKTDVKSVPQSVRAEQTEFVPNTNANSFFSPQDPNDEVFSSINQAFTNIESPKKEEKTEMVQEPIKPKEPLTEYNTAVNNDVVYYNSVDPSEEIEMEGRRINSVEIAGLNYVSPDLLTPVISTHIGSSFNSEALQEDLKNIYATGYFTDLMAVEPSVRYDGTVDLVFTLQENIPVTDVTVCGNNVIPTAELQPFVAPLKNMPQNLNKINEAVGKINDYYHDKGYILASISSVDDDAKGNILFTVNEGVINSINIEGNTKTKDYIIQRNIMTQAGSVYNEECLKKDLSNVFATQYFEDVNREIKPAEDGKYDVTVIVKEKNTEKITIGGGIDTGLGIFGTAGISEDNFRGRGQKISLNGIVGTGILMSDSSIKNRINYQVELNFFEPYLLNPETSLASKLYFRELGSYHVPLAIERRFGLSGTIEHKVKDSEHLSTTFTAGVEHIGLREGDFNKISSLYRERGLDIAQRDKQLIGGFFVHLAPGVRYNSLDTQENPREGIIAQAKYDEALAIGNMNRTHGKLSGAVTRFFPVFKKSSLSLTAKGGIKVHGNEMPEIMTYALGGPYSIRGFKMSGVGTGNSFLMGSAELATPIPFFDKIKYEFFHKMRLTFFLDAGKVFDPTITNTLYDRPGSAISMGVGLRFYVPNIGPISIDYGLPLTNPGRNGNTGGYFTFGTGGINGYDW